MWGAPTGLLGPHITATQHRQALPFAASLPASCRLHACRVPSLPHLSTPRAAPRRLQALSCGYATDTHAPPLRCWSHSCAAEGAWGARPGLALPLRCASTTRARSAAADAQGTGAAAVSDDQAQTQVWPRTEPTQDRLQSSPVLAATAPPAGSSVDASHARAVENGTQSQEGAPSRRSDAGGGGAGAGSRGAPGAEDSSAAAGASAQAPDDSAQPSRSGQGAGAAQTLSRPRGLDHAGASAASAGGPRPPDRAAGGSEGKRAGPSRRAGEQRKGKSDAEREEEDAAGLAWLARLGGRWGTDMPSTVAGWRARALSYMRESFLIGYTTVVDNVLATALQIIRADELFYWITPRLERGIATITGAWHMLPDGRVVPLSLVNDTAPTLAPPQQYQPRDFPFGGHDAFDLRDADLLALAMRLIYEREEVFQDVAERGWGLRCAGYFVTGGTDHQLYSDPQNTAEFNPRTGSAVLANEQALIVVFRGTEPTNLINFRSSGRISMSERPGLGRVHDGFFGALFHGDPEAGCLFDQLVETLEAADAGAGRAIYLTGHSLGGALAVVFAASLRQARPQLAERIGGVFTYGAPRVGDAAFSRHFDDAFGGRAFRVTHGADIIPHVPPRWLEYEHCGAERYITSFGRILSDPKDMQRWRNYETWGFIPFALAKLALGLVDPKESKLRALYRLVCLVLLPGLSDHFPADYEFKLRRALEKGKEVEK